MSLFHSTLSTLPSSSCPTWSQTCHTPSKSRSKERNTWPRSFSTRPTWSWSPSVWERPTMTPRWPEWRRWSWSWSWTRDRIPQPPGVVLTNKIGNDYNKEGPEIDGICSLWGAVRQRMKRKKHCWLLMVPKLSFLICTLLVPPTHHQPLWLCLKLN